MESARVSFQMFVFVGWICASVAMISKVEVGLDQKLSMPQVRAWPLILTTVIYCIVETLKLWTLLWIIIYYYAQF